jgi:hypothetical protein
MKRAKDATLVLCLFVVYCVLLSQGLRTSAVSAFFGALAAVPLTVHLYHRLWPAPLRKDAEQDRRQVRRDGAEAEPELLLGKVGERVRHTD